MADADAATTTTAAAPLDDTSAVTETPDKSGWSLWRTLSFASYASPESTSKSDAAPEPEGEQGASSLPAEEKDATAMSTGAPQP